MKKLVFFVILFLSLFFFQAYAVDCDFNGNIGQSLDNCLDGTDLVDASGPTLVEWNLKIQFVNWTLALGGILGLFAVGAIVYGSLLLTLSGGDEEKISHGKDIVKWSLIGFLWVITASGLVRLVIEVIFWVAW